MVDLDNQWWGPCVRHSWEWITVQLWACKYDVVAYCKPEIEWSLSICHVQSSIRMSQLSLWRECSIDITIIGHDPLSARCPQVRVECHLATCLLTVLKKLYGGYKVDVGQWSVFRARNFDSWNRTRPGTGQDRRWQVWVKSVNLAGPHRSLCLVLHRRISMQKWQTTVYILEVSQMKLYPRCLRSHSTQLYGCPISTPTKSGKNGGRDGAALHNGVMERTLVASSILIIRCAWDVPCSHVQITWLCWSIAYRWGRRILYGESWCCIMQVGCLVLILRIYVRKPWVRWRSFRIRQSHKHPIFVPLVDEPGGPTSRVTHVLDAYPRSSDRTLDRSFGGGNWSNTFFDALLTYLRRSHVTTIPDHFFDFRRAKL